MCGIVAVLSRPDPRPEPDLGPVVLGLQNAAEQVRAWGTVEQGDLPGLTAAVEGAERGAATLRGFVGQLALLRDGAASTLTPVVERLGEAVLRFEQLLDQQGGRLESDEVEHLNALLVRLKDVHFTVDHDRLGNVERVRGLAGGSERPAHLRAAYDINVALNALDRLEVRGRDSAGLHLMVRGAFGPLVGEAAEEFERRSRIPLFTHLAVRAVAAGDSLTTLQLRLQGGRRGRGPGGQRPRPALGDRRRRPAPRAARRRRGVTADILGHTRWASVGVISEAERAPAEPRAARRRRRPLRRWPRSTATSTTTTALMREEGLRVPTDRSPPTRR